MRKRDVDNFLNVVRKRKLQIFCISILVFLGFERPPTRNLRRELAVPYPCFQTTPVSYIRLVLIDFITCSFHLGYHCFFLAFVHVCCSCLDICCLCWLSCCEEQFEVKPTQHFIICCHWSVWII